MIAATRTVFSGRLCHTKLANVAELAIPVALWLAWHERGARAIYAAAAVVLSATVVAAASRGGMVVLVIELFVLGFLATRRSPKKALIFTGALSFGISVCGWDLAWNRFAADPLRDLRLPIMSSALEMANRYWLTGSGLGTWSTVYPEFAHFDIHLLVNQAHCDWLQWLDEGGICFPISCC